jgi:hypothetical protein
MSGGKQEWDPAPSSSPKQFGIYGENAEIVGNETTASQMLS